MSEGERPQSFSWAWFKMIGLVVWQSIIDFGEDAGTQWAAAISYYSLLSLFPLLLGLASVAAFFVDPDWAVEQITRALGEFLPMGEGEVTEIVQGAVEARAGAGIISILALFWTGTRVFGALTMALNILFDAAERYSFFKRLLVELLMLLTIGVLFILALSSGFVIDLLARITDILPGEGVIILLLRWALPALLMLLAFFLVYRFVPRRDVDWQAALPGAIVAALAVAVGRPIFFFYVEEFGQYNVIYGSIGIIIILIFWAWIVAVITLLCAELASHIQMMVREGKSREEVERRHRRRSPERTSEEAEPA